MKTSSGKLKRMMAGKNAGMAIMEYAVVGASIAVVCIAGCLVMGNNLSSWITGLKADASEQIQATKAEKVAIVAAKAQFEAEAAKAARANIANIETEALSSSGGDSLCSGEWCISAPGLTGPTVSTAGSNGTQMVQLTSSAAGIYSQLAKVLSDQGADASIVNLLTNMANQGHALGTAQSTFLGDGDYASMKQGMLDYQSGLSNFQQMDQQLRSLLPQLPADTRGVLQDASNVIIGIGNSYTLNTGSGGTSEIGWSYQSSNIALTHANSNTICSNGGDTSSCMQ